jgi:hypothetical protein
MCCRVWSICRHLDAQFGGDSGHAVLARAGVTTALDPGTPRRTMCSRSRIGTAPA